ncbi:ubiquitin-protein ligase [Vairimorpha apis BRL 01]|uniref:HECT-type E3 ubiquitin transferase n=1 Tax=Vairimorpha apis BRL 01 TaxID=1037528 RepID=T0L4F6_9MICR|nr:ubiquitin-protein ligase [Vairimorpha apis BRL 01]
MFNISVDKKRKLCDYRCVDGGFLDGKEFDKKSADKKSLVDGECNDGSDIRNVDDECNDGFLDGKGFDKRSLIDGEYNDGFLDGKYTNISHNNIINDKHNNIKYNKNLILNKEIFYNFKFDETDLLTSCGIYEGLVNTLILFECEDKMKIVEEWNIKRKEIEKYISGVVNGEKCVNGYGNNNSIGDEVNDKNNNSIGDEVDIIRDIKNNIINIDTDNNIGNNKYNIKDEKEHKIKKIKVNEELYNREYKSDSINNKSNMDININNISDKFNINIINDKSNINDNTSNSTSSINYNTSYNNHNKNIHINQKNLSFNPTQILTPYNSSLHLYLSLSPLRTFNTYFKTKLNLLTFTQKQKYLQTKINNPIDGTYTITVHRNTILNDSFFQIMNKPSKFFKSKKLQIKFAGEDGIDYGGVTKEWLQLLINAFTDVNQGLFKLNGNLLLINEFSGVNSEHLMFLSFWAYFRENYK